MSYCASFRNVFCMFVCVNLSPVAWWEQLLCLHRKEVPQGRLGRGVYHEHLQLSESLPLNLGGDRGAFDTNFREESTQGQLNVTWVSEMKVWVTWE